MDNLMTLALEAEYYDRLMAIRNSRDWEGWQKFFLRGVREVSVSAAEVARQIVDMRKQHRQLIPEKLTSSANAHKLLDSVPAETFDDHSSMGPWPVYERQFRSAHGPGAHATVCD